MTPLYPQGVPQPQSILVVLPTWVGDFVMATPALQAVRSRFPSATITLLIVSNLLDLAHDGPWMDECVTWPPRGKGTFFSAEYRKLVRRLRAKKFDCAILFSNSFRSALLARMVGARTRIGFDRDARGWLLTHPIPVPNRRASRNGSYSRTYPSLSTTPATNMGLHIPGRPSRFHPIPLVEYYADLVEAIGCPRPGDDLRLFTSPAAEMAVEKRIGALGITGGPLVALSPGAKFGASKCWAPERFAQAADRLIAERSASVVITCGPGEEPIAEAIATAMKRPAHVLTNPPLSLGELKSLICRCDLLIANDAGPRHIAKAFGVPVVTVFGPTHPDWTATNYPREQIVRVDVDCGPCQQRICPLGHHQCMEFVSVDMVVTAARELLEPDESATMSMSVFE